MNSEDKILIVDDDTDHLFLLQRYVSSLGFQFESVESGAEAIKCMKAETISVLVTDIVMPKMDGMELLVYTKANYPEIDVIVMTGYSSHYSYTDVIKAGATDFITKPFKKDELQAKIDRVFKERKLLHELKVSEEKALAGSKAKTSFLSTIGHELLTPMNGIMGFTTLLANADLQPKEMSYVKMVAKSTDRLMKLINQILDFSRIDAGKSCVKPCHFQLKAVFDELFSTVQTRAEEKGVVLDLEADETLADTIFFGDNLTLAQILYNLTDNALKFTDSGSIILKVRKVRTLSDDTIELQFSIKDSGCGLNPEEQDSIFEPFNQAEDYMTRKHEGAGLGLAICAKLVSLINGKIWVESCLGKGSTFYFTVSMQTV